MTSVAPAMPRRSLPPVSGPVVPNLRLAMVVLVTAELMLFAGLVGMYLTFRLQTADWPPPGQPRLPVGLTAFNTAVLALSGIALAAARRAGAAGDTPLAARRLGWALGLGLSFLGVQGIEWTRLVRHGLTLGANAYGGAFYLVIGCHALHVLVGTLLLGVAALRPRRERLSPPGDGVFEAGAIYWYFVVGLWLLLFPLVYLY
jgi:heme/copper-type cytochrome/quinol oxidase subunit 3